MADIIKPDLCIIGAGALGATLALKASQRGLGVVLVACGGPGSGDTVGFGLRRAAFMAAAERAQALRTASDAGLANADPKPNFRAIGEHGKAIADAAASALADERLAAHGVTLLAGTASFSDRQTLHCGDAVIRARQFVLATGARPLVPSLPGLDQVPYFTADTIADNIRKLTHLVVIGGEPAALELAQAYRRLGSQVTVVPQGGLLPGFDPEIVAVLVRALREEGVVIVEDAQVAAIVPRSQGTGVTLRRADGEESLDVSHILVAMGHVPVLDTDLLAKARLRSDGQRPGHLMIGTDGQTSNARISAIGGACGQHQPHIGLLQASLLVERLLGEGNGVLEPLQVPRLVATQPALAQVGILDEAPRLRPGQTVLRSNLAESDAARATGKLQGLAKLVLTHRGTIIGAGTVGQGAGETIAMLALVMSRGLPASALGRLALPVPSAASALLDLARQAQTGRPRRRLPLVGRFLP